MRRALIPAFLLLLASFFLGATVFREQVAQAAQAVSATIVGPLDAQGNVKVHEQGTANTHEQNTDANGDIKVHEQGTASTRIVGYPQASTVAEGGGNNDFDHTFSTTINASTIVLNVLGGPGIFEIVSPGGNVEFSDYVGPNSTVTIPLNETVQVASISGGCTTSCRLDFTIVGN